VPVPSVYPLITISSTSLCRSKTQCRTVDRREEHVCPGVVHGGDQRRIAQVVKPRGDYPVLGGVSPVSPFEHPGGRTGNHLPKSGPWPPLSWTIFRVIRSPPTSSE